MYGGSITAGEMSLALGAEGGAGEGGTTTLDRLRESIRTHGGIIHPILVNRDEQARLVVIEGNTRTLIYREFQEQGVPGEWTRIPAMVHSGLSDADVDAIRLQAHLVGPRAWDPYSKARYLDFLRNSQHLTMAQIVDFCGGRKKEVETYIAAYNDMEESYRPLLESDDQFDPTRFSAFVELQKSNIQEALLNAGFTKRDFAEWVNDQLLYPLATVRQLPRLLANPRAKDVFLRDGAQEAIKLLDVPSPDAALQDASLEHLARELVRRVLGMSYSDLQALRSDLNASANVAICDARDQLIQLCSDVVSDE
jgi:hypothetical protein